MDINADLHIDLSEMFQITLMVIAGQDQYQIHTHILTHWNQIIPTTKKVINSKMKASREGEENNQPTKKPENYQ